MRVSPLVAQRKQFFSQKLQLISRKAQLGEQHDVCAHICRIADHGNCVVKVRLHIAELRPCLGQRDVDRSCHIRLFPCRFANQSGWHDS